MQFKAGYIVDSIAKIITDQKVKYTNNNDADPINGLLKYVSSFDVDFPQTYNGPNYKNLKPILATLNNIVTRGLPTKAPVFLEEQFVKIGLIEPNTKEHEFKFLNSTKDIQFQTVFELLHILEPSLNIDETDYAGEPGSRQEWLFLHEMLNEYPFAKQVLQSQRQFKTINRNLAGGRSVDYSYEFPYLKSEQSDFKKRGVIFEYDGKHHQYNSYKYYDKYRDDVASSEDFETLRQSSDELVLDLTIVEEFKNDIYKIFAENFKRDVNDSLHEYSLIFIPLAVARIQKTIIEYFLAEPELLDSETISIAIIERDVPCGALAIETLKQLFENINALLEAADQKKLPQIELSIYQTEKWVIDSALHLGAQLKDEPHFEKSKFDIIIDHSILRRSNIYKEKDFQQHKHDTIKIRSSHYFDNTLGSARRVYCADLLKYKRLAEKQDDGSYLPIVELKENINYFVQNIFRKISFRNGQLPIISRALELKPVIGLLPTGGGKSITYQLPAFLQPGLCLVVDPIKSLMEDQVRVLKQNWIDCCEYINSNLEREEKAKRLIDFRYGETMFLFVSPERFAMTEFRNIINLIDNSKYGLAFTYGVIDEVHCVSEWGHDFRTSYLMLGKNLQQYSKVRAKNTINLIGLTATASFDVLTDIERELNILQENVSDAIISIDNTIRPELIFNVIENNEKPIGYPQNDQNIKDFIGEKKQALLNSHNQVILEKFDSISETDLEVLVEQHIVEFDLNDKLTKDVLNNNELAKAKLKAEILAKMDFHSFEDVPTVVFCPHTKGSFGVTQEVNRFPNRKEVFENLNVTEVKKGYFIGGDENVSEEVKKNVQQHFVDFMEDKINYMVCTKAFGMGIDKDNIRSVYHLNFPSSPESYIQEAGRAGRDKALAICTILFDRNKYYTVKENFIKKNYPNLFPNIENRKNVREIFENYSGGRQNRLHRLFFMSEDTLKAEFFKLGINLNPDYIEHKNIDFETNEFFHSNSFKGKDKEIFQIDRFFNYNEGINTNQLNLLQNKYNFENDDAMNFSFSSVFIRNLFFNKSTNNPIGKLRTDRYPLNADINVGADGEPDLEKSKEIVSFLIAECEEYNLKNNSNHNLYDFLNLEVIKGLNDGKSLIEFFNDNKDKNEFEFEVPVEFNNNDLASKIEKDFNLAKLNFIHNERTTIDFINTLISKSFDFEDFILRVEEQWNINLLGTTIFERKRGDYKKAYYSEIGKLDVQRIIYRLYSIGFVQDYTIDYNLGIITITFLKKAKQFYVNQTETHLLKYLSRSSVNDVIIDIEKKLAEKKDVFDTIKECVKHILEITYKDIVAKRKRATEDLNRFIGISG